MKKVIIFCFTILMVLGIWYLFIKEYDYQITFTAKGTPGSIYHQIVGWESWGKDVKAKNITTVDTVLYREIKQKVNLPDTILNLKWDITSVNDSISKIKVGVFLENQSLMNRLSILTGETIFTRSLKKEFKIFGKGLNNFAKTFRIKIEGASEIPVLEYLYISSNANRSGKAGMMLRTNADIFPKIKENNLKINGLPFVKVKEWNEINDKIQFDFGFPIKYKDSLPVSSIIKYAKVASQKAIKATFYGNYRHSDQAWFAIMEYAKRRNILIEKKPLEIFYNNPMQEGDASKWKAEIFMPLK
ncbi:GyrI-like domain-containing protein [Aquimarina sp. 433]